MHRNPCGKLLFARSSSRPPGGGAPLRAPLLALVCLLVGARARAQEIRGTVLDQTTRLPVAAASVSLVGAKERPITEVLTDSVGGFVLELDDAGAFVLEAHALGYAAVTSSRLEVAYGELVEVVLRLAADAVPLEPLVVKARSHPPNQYLENAGFYARRRAGVGTFLTRAEIMRGHPEELSDVLRQIPGLVGTPAGLPGRRAWSLNSRTGMRCQPVLVLDGLATLTGGQQPLRSRDTPLDDAVSPRDIEGLEVYLGPAGVPVNFNVSNSSCGAIVVWTRRK